jgi:hypothetical protein
MARTKTGGRKAGVPNRITGELRTMILDTLIALGGVEYLKRVAEENPAAFCALLAKLLPKAHTVSGDPVSPVLTRIEIVHVGPGDAP